MKVNVGNEFKATLYTTESSKLHALKFWCDTDKCNLFTNKLIQHCYHHTVCFNCTIRPTVCPESGQFDSSLVKVGDLYSFLF